MHVTGKDTFLYSYVAEAPFTLLQSSLLPAYPATGITAMCQHIRLVWH